MAGHEGAVEFDLMTMTRFTLDDLGGALSLRALRSFVSHLGPGSATWRSANPGEENARMATWACGTDGLKHLVADVVDAVNMLSYQVAAGFVGLGGKRMKGSPPKPIPRPGVGGGDETAERYGRDAVRVSDFGSFWYGEEVRKDG